MADTKITALSAFAQIDPATDLFVAVDTSDTAMAASGTDKKLTSSFIRYAVLSDITGAVYEYVSADTIRITAGTLGVNGKVVSVAATSFNPTGSAATQAKNIAGANITSWVANSAYFIFVKEDGTIAFEIYDGTGDGAAPVMDVGYGYFKSAATGLAYRRIGKFMTGLVDTIIPFKLTGERRERLYWVLNQTAKLLVSGTVNDTTYTPIPGFGAYLSADDAATKWVLTCTAVAPSSIMGVLLSVNGTDAIFQSTVVNGTALTTAAQFGVENSWCPYTGQAHFQTSGGSPAYIGIAGFGFTV